MTDKHSRFPAVRIVRAATVLPLALALSLFGCDAKQGGGTASSKSSSGTASSKSSGPPGGDIIQLPTTSACEDPPPNPNGLPAPADVGAPPADATKTASGLVTKVISAASAAADGGVAKNAADGGATQAIHPGPTDTVKVHYTGWTKKGTMFDSSVQRGEPAVFPLNGVIKGWTEGLQLMTVGEKRRLWIPAEAAYGPTTSKKGPCGDLVFDVELIEVIRPPDDLATPPTTKTPSGVPYKLVHKGTGPQAKAADTATFHVVGWTNDGQLFKNTVAEGRPMTVPVNKLPKPLEEAIEMMKVGDKLRLWAPAELLIPPDQAKQAGAPKMLVLDLELLSTH